MSDAVIDRRPLPVGSVGYRSSGWWAMIGLIASEAALFAYLLFSYYYLAVQPHSYPWPPQPMELKLSGPDTVILLLSSVAAWWGERGAKHNKPAQQLAGLTVAFVLGVAFVAIQIFEWKSRTFGIASQAYGSLYFTVTGFHMAHVIAGIITLLALFVWSWLGCFGPRRNAAITIGVVYWHFVDAVWLAVFFTFYISPHLI